jgi:hypothetical protein
VRKREPGDKREGKERKSYVSTFRERRQIINQVTNPTGIQAHQHHLGPRGTSQTDTRSKTRFLEAYTHCSKIKRRNTYTSVDRHNQEIDYLCTQTKDFIPRLATTTRHTESERTSQSSVEQRGVSTEGRDITKTVPNQVLINLA